MLVITVCSTKGGTGKTTLTANLAGALADAGYPTLLVDADPQPTLSSYYPLDYQAPGGLRELVTGSTDPQLAISRTAIEGLDVVVSNDPAGSLSDWILHTPDGRVRMRRTIREIEGYEFVLIDTQGAISPLQDVGVLAADFLVSPIPPEILSTREFARGTVAMLERLRPMQHLGAPVGHLYGVIYRMDRTSDARRVAEGIRRAAFAEGDKGSITITETVIPAAVAYREAATARLPIHRLSSRNPAPREAVLGLIEELLPHVELDRLDVERLQGRTSS